MSEYSNADVKIYIDDKEQETIVKRLKRNDVYSVIKNCGNKESNLLPGYISSLDISKLKTGEHTLKIEAVTKEGKVLKSQTTKIIKKYDTTLWVDSVINNKDVNNTLSVSGWVMSEDKNATIKASIQNTNIVETNFSRFERNDVLSVIKNCGGKNTNTKPGYSGTIDISKLPDGVHNVLIQVISSSDNTVLAEEVKTIKVRYL